MTTRRTSKRWLLGGAAAFSAAGLAGGAAAAAALSPSSHPARLVNAAVAAQSDPSSSTTAPSGGNANPATPATGAAPTKGKRVSDVIDGLVADGTITKEQGDKVKAAIEAARPQGGDHGPGRGGPGMGGRGMGGPGMGGFGFGGIQQASKAVADALGITTDALRTELQGGKSLADIATAHGKTKQDMVDVLTKQAKAHLDEEVTQGDLTQAQADDFLAKAKTMIDTAVSTPLPAGFGFGPGHGRGPGKAGANGSAPSSSTSPSTTTN